MTRALFSAGLNWKMIENKWPSFKRAFSGFEIEKVAGLGEKKIGTLLADTGIVRNEKKIRATVHNAGQFLEIKKEFGGFAKYLKSISGEEELQDDLQHRFHLLGPSSSRIFLCLSGYPLTPNKEEKAWIAGPR